ncbi:hypothetical protein [Streptomyces sp. NPDC018000]|uniref:hypothetical protein n=1 Tax=Streptomyces sp. NPDC018000 TaxID=3365028 RepID=UPI0037AE3008
MDHVHARGRALARLMAVGALLFGLFLMHGAPATAASGCHGAVSAPAPAHDEQAGHRGHSERAMGSMAPMAIPGSAHPSTQAVTGGHGAQCVATPARDRLPLLTVWLLAVTVFAVLSGWALIGRRVAAGEAGLRGPPGGGRDLLLRVCVART